MRKCMTCQHYQTATGVMDWCDKNNPDFMRKYLRCKDYVKREAQQ